MTSENCSTRNRLLIRTGKIFCTLICAGVGFIAVPHPANADRFAYEECRDRCKETGSLNSCFYNCESFMDRPGPPPLPASDPFYGAIAVDGATLKSGFAKDELSSEDAQAHAINQCRKAGGAVDGCKVVVSRRNSCLALATSSGGSNGPTWGYAYSDDGLVSRREAMKYCRDNGGANCQVAISFCTG